MINQQVEIVSDGTAKGTRVLVEGKELKGIRQIVINPITPGSHLTATITILKPKISIKAEADLGEK